ncbi:VanW family protein [Tsukamurella sp. 8F]|uniref:VanW family protein n=1 Tax=unclassified Tsukamurella TaxID=2633480 RepID=UPI0023B9E894|nr:MULTISPECIES: VanW family protein [unclassified Tsukamurella]MDF0531372.1 VanW family protein [Tsukamurella sp. 8J]MDF0585322.1 VanW family protein [Tsukamurella sp. 8F]
MTGRVARTPIVVAAVAMLLGAAGAAWVGRDVTVAGATAAGVDIGGLSRAEAERKLASRTTFGQTDSVTLRTPDGSVVLPPAELGLAVDVPATVDRAIEARTPWRSLTGTFGGRTTVPAASRVDRTTFDSAVARSATRLTHAMVDGAVEFKSGRPVAVQPRPGIAIDPGRAAAAVTAAWPDSHVVDVPTDTAQPTVTAATVEATMRGAAHDVVASDVVVRGKGAPTVRVTPTDIGGFLSYRPDGKGALVARTDQAKLAATVRKRLAPVAVKAKDASFRFEGGAPVLVPGAVGRDVDWTRTTEAVSNAVTAKGAGRTVDATLRATRPKVTTARAKGLGVKEVVSEFTTGGFKPDSGQNIRRVAEEVSGALILPGETFSLNGYTGTRGAAQGYVDAGIINHGRPDRAVGGGISQFATTLYNAAYFAGLQDVDHTEHSYYISRYPPAREATVYDGAIDLSFKNDTQHGVVIQAFADSSSVTVRMWSTKTRKVQSITGSRSAVTQPGTERLSGDDCIAATGQPGFTVSDTRVVTDIRTGAQLSRHTNTVEYDPEPNVICTK